MTQPDQPSKELLAICAHDLRGALTVIVGYVGLLRRDDLTAAEREEALDGIDAAIGRADALLGDTLAGRSLRPNESARIELVALAERAAADARAATGREVRMIIDGEAIVTGDASALARALGNLLSNAAKYAPEGPIDIRVSQEGRRAIIEVSDRGPGIPEDERASVLEPFARLPRDADTPGTGLGLTVVRSVAQRMDGLVEICAREGGGTVVRLEMPAAV